MNSLLNSVCIDGLQPKPFEFVNSVSNAAGFYLAQLLELEGPNLFLGAHPDIWQQLLQLAACDLATGSARQALLIHCMEDSAGNARLHALLTTTGTDTDGGSITELEHSTPF